MRLWAWLRGWEYLGDATSRHIPVHHHALMKMRRKNNDKISSQVQRWQKKHKDKSTSFHSVAYGKDAHFVYKAKEQYSFDGHRLKNHKMKVWRKKR